MTYDKYQSAFEAAFRAAGHEFVLNDRGEPDWLAHAPNGHNGPECAACGWHCCMWCSGPEKIPKCEGTERKAA